jgi:hypothetical protein
MDEQTPNIAGTKRAGRVFTIVALFLMLIVLPAGSYIYLKKGFNWRLKAQSELGDFGRVKEINHFWPDGQKENLIEKKVCVLYFFGEAPALTPENQKIVDTGVELVKQFGFKPGSETNNFRLVMIASNSPAEFKSYYQTRENADLSNWIWAGGLGSWTTILKNGYDYYCQSQKVTPYQQYFAVSDTSGTIRRFYNAQDPDEVNRMVQHIAILMPKEK